jgi:putative nucleotidyltransferase with HDIG domain
VDIQVARELAASKLAESLPRRWRHVRAVAAKSARIAVILPEAERPLLVAAAWLHDVGYAPDLALTGLHALDGARWLRGMEFDERVVTMVANHSCATYEADERGLGKQLRSEFPAHPSPLADCLWYADMTTGPDGQDFDVLERLEEVRARCGPDHIVTRFWAKAEPTIVAAVRRTEQRLTPRALPSDVSLSPP